jgi:hypothetical protein
MVDPLLTGDGSLKAERRRSEQQLVERGKISSEPLLVGHPPAKAWRHIVWVDDGLEFSVDESACLGPDGRIGRAVLRGPRTADVLELITALPTDL